MKLNEKQFQQALKNPLECGYWLNSDEELLLIEASDKLRKAAVNQGFNDRTMVHADNKTDWGEVFSAANALSLFADKTFIEIRLASGKPSATIQKALQSYFANPNPDALILISSPKLDASFLKTKTYKSLEASLNIATFWQIDAQQLPAWLAQRAASMGLSFEDSALQFFADSIEGNLLAAQQQLLQLSLFTDNKHINETDLREIISSNARFDVFGTLEKALAGEIDDTMRAINGLQHEGLAPANISWAFTREIQKLIKIRQDAKQLGPEQALQRNGVWKRQEAIYRKALNRLKTQALEAALQLCQQLDAQSKGQAAGNPWDTMAELVFLMGGHRLPITASR